MQTLELLAVGLGLAGLAGINLYLTVFVTGLAIRFEWIQLSEAYAKLEVLGDPLIIGVAGFLFFIEFFADKVPWVDSLWDSVHTVIRPVGGAMLAILALGEPSPVFEVLVGLLAGGVALTAHAAKAGGRLLVNASPEPFSNIGLSLGEDGLVLGGLALLVWNPFVAVALLVLCLVGVFALAPRMARAVRAKLWFIWRKLSLPAEDGHASAGGGVPVEVECLVHQEHPGNAKLAWAIPVVSRRVSGFPCNTRGWLLEVEAEQPGVYFAGRRGGGFQLRRIGESLARAEYARGFLCDRLKTGEGELFVDRGRRMVVENQITAARQPQPAVA